MVAVRNRRGDRSHFLFLAALLFGYGHVCHGPFNLCSRVFALRRLRAFYWGESNARQIASHSNRSSGCGVGIRGHVAALLMHWAVKATAWTKACWAVFFLCCRLRPLPREKPAVAWRRAASPVPTVAALFFGPISLAGYCLVPVQAIKRACQFHSSVSADRRQAVAIRARLSAWTEAWRLQTSDPCQGWPGAPLHNQRRGLVEALPGDHPGRFTDRRLSHLWRSGGLARP